MEQKVIIVTGAASGIGLSVARHMIKQGHIVYGADIQLELMQENIVDDRFHPHFVDLAEPFNIVQFVDTVVRNEGKIDALINIAGYAVFGPVEIMSHDRARKQFEVNFFGLAYITKKVIPHMRDQKHGLIINMSSIAGKLYIPYGSWYVASKHALEGWSDSIRTELKPFGIKVVIVEPGIIHTEFSNESVKIAERYIDLPEYKRFLIPLVKTFRRSDTIGKKADAEHAATLIDKIVNARNPKRRYAVGALAKPLMRSRKLFGDGFFDWLLSKMIKY